MPIEKAGLAQLHTIGAFLLVYNRNKQLNSTNYSNLDRLEAATAGFARARRAYMLFINLPSKHLNIKLSSYRASNQIKSNLKKNQIKLNETKPIFKKNQIELRQWNKHNLYSIKPPQSGFYRAGHLPAKTYTKAQLQINGLRRPMRQRRPRPTPSPLGN